MGMFFKNKKSQQNIVYTRRVLPIATMKSKKDSSPARCPGDPSCTYGMTHHRFGFAFIFKYF